MKPKLDLGMQDPAGYPTREEIGKTIAHILAQEIPPVSEQAFTAAYMIDNLFSFLRDEGIPVFSVDGTQLIGRARLNEAEVKTYMDRKVTEDAAKQLSGKLEHLHKTVKLT